MVNQSPPHLLHDLNANSAISLQNLFAFNSGTGPLLYAQERIRAERLSASELIQKRLYNFQRTASQSLVKVPGLETKLHRVASKDSKMLGEKLESLDATLTLNCEADSALLEHRRNKLAFLPVRASQASSSEGLYARRVCSFTLSRHQLGAPRPHPSSADRTHLQKPFQSAAKAQVGNDYFAREDELSTLPRTYSCQRGCAEHLLYLG
jgi:hypothetical protein